MKDKLIDIKPIVEINDNSIFILIATLFVSIVIGAMLFRFFYNLAKNNCSVDCYRYYLYMFSNIDWSNPKEAAYLATKYGEVLAQDRRRKELFNQLRERLDRYKYKRDSVSIDTQTINYYNLYKQVCDESI